jgi:hypothetical protein
MSEKKTVSIIGGILFGIFILVKMWHHGDFKDQGAEFQKEMDKSFHQNGQ